MSLRNREFIQAVRSLGMRDLPIIFREILPNALPPIVVYASVIMAIAILLESALAFLNLSDPNVPSWGNLIGGGRSVLREQWYVSAIPGIAILLTVLAVSLVGQGINDALNPRLKTDEYTAVDNRSQRQTAGQCRSALCLAPGVARSARK